MQAQENSAQKAAFSVCISGHRPSKLPPPRERRVLKSILVSELIEAIEAGANVFYCGMAEGIDLDAAEALVVLRAQHPQIRLIAVIPFPEQDRRYSAAERYRYRTLLKCADQVICICRKYEKNCYQLRNYYMVDHSRRLIAVMHSPRSGTGQTYRYAQEKKLEIHLISARLDPKGCMRQ